MSAKIVSINISENKGTTKKPVKEAVVIENYGIKEDAHAGSHWHRQVSLLAEESIQKMKDKGLNLNYGDFAENITTEGIDLLSLPIGTKLKIDDVILEITQHGKECHTKCDIFKIIKACIMPKEGVFARVIKGGKIKVGDEIVIL